MPSCATFDSDTEKHGRFVGRTCDDAPAQRDVKVLETEGRMWGVGGRTIKVGAFDD